ncbi:MAG: hypothetical protein AAF657_36150 [Acidobacteriota bacterium]
MSKTKRMRLARVLWIAAVWIVWSVGSASAATEGGPAELAGSWTMIPELSDDPREVLEERLEERQSEGRPGRRLAAKRRAKKAKKKIEEARQSFADYENLEIVVEEATLTLTDAKGVEHTIYLDGREVAEARGSRQSSGLWQDGRLVVTQQTERGEAQQVFRLKDSQLHVETTFAGDRSKGLTLRRVYGRETQ